MTDQLPEKSRDLPIINLLPNLLTITAICAGLTAIRFGYQGDFETAVKLILLACILDGLDGRLARLLRCQSSMGAELDSLADFLNFGVAPGLIVHAWALQEYRSVGWMAVLGYSICCVLRLARFNVSSRLETEKESKDFFVGVPSPAGAMLALLPMYIAFMAPDMGMLPPLLVAIYIFSIGLLMICRLPTYSFKNISISRGKVKFLILGVALSVSALLTYFWATLVLMTVVYFCVLLWGVLAAWKPKT